MSSFLYNASDIDEEQEKDETSTTTTRIIIIRINLPDHLPPLQNDIVQRIINVLNFVQYQPILQFSVPLISLEQLELNIGSESLIKNEEIFQKQMKELGFLKINSQWIAQYHRTFYETLIQNIDVLLLESLLQFMYGCFAFFFLSNMKPDDIIQLYCDDLQIKNTERKQINDKRISYLNYNPS